MAHELVSVKGLAVKFLEPVLEGIFLDLKKGEFVSVVGKSGVGKTTMLNALSGLVGFDGEIRKPKKVSLVFQNHVLFPWMNVRENIAFGLEKPDAKLVEQIIDLIGLRGKENSLPAKLSGGQQQRVAIGRALAIKPDLLLLDEPFSSLDSFTRIQMQEWIRKVLEKEKTTVLLVTHDVDEAILLSDRVFVLKNKALEKEFTVQFNRPRSERIRFSLPFQQLKKEILESY